MSNAWALVLFTRMSMYTQKRNEMVILKNNPIMHLFTSTSTWKIKAYRLVALQSFLQILFLIFLVKKQWRIHSIQ